MPAPAPPLIIGPLTLSLVDGALQVQQDGVTRVLRPATVAAVFARYGRPLDDAVVLGGDANPLLRFDDGAGLGAVAYRAPVDVIANDYAVYFTSDGTRLAVPAPLFAAALAALARAAPTGESG